MIKAQEVKLYDILPTLLKRDKTIAAIVKVLQKYIDENYEYIERLNILSNIDNIENEELIDHLAYQFHVDFYDPSLNLDKKRKLVKRSIAQHRKKGTGSAVEEVLYTVFGKPELQEWFEYGGEPYHFRTVVEVPDKTIIDPNEAQKAKELINRYKNTRSWLEFFFFLNNTKSILALTLKTYEFPNQLKITDEFHTEDNLPGYIERGPIRVANKTYEFPVYLGITDIMTTETIAVDSQLLDVINKSYTPYNEVIFKRTGVTTMGEGEI